MYDPWLNERQAISSRVESEAAQAARQAASVLGQEQVSQQLAEARAMGERQAIEAAQRLEAEAHHVQHMHYLQATGQIGGHAPVAGVSGTAPPSQGLPTRPPPYVSPEQKAARLQAEQERLRAEQEQQRRLRAEQDELLRIQNMRSKQKKVLARIREYEPGRITTDFLLKSALVYLSAASLTYLGIGLSVLLITGSWSGGFSWMWLCALGVALVIPAFPILSEWVVAPLAFSLIPISLSLLHLRSDFSIWKTVLLLAAIGLLAGIVYLLNLVAWSEWQGNARRNRVLLGKNLPCDYCGRKATNVKRIPSKFGVSNISVLACWDHSHSTLWTEELEVALLDATIPPAEASRTL
jgi:hypothetical protein